MKILAVFAVLLAVTAGYPIVNTWTLNELSYAIEKSEGDPEMREYLIDALNQIMYALFTGTNEEAIHTNILSPTGNRKWTMAELKTELRKQELSNALRPYYERSYHYLLNDKPEGTESEVEVVIPALDISTWSITDLSDAMENPDTNPALKPFLEKAKTEIKAAMEAGLTKESVTLVTPVGLVPMQSDANPTIVPRKS